MEARNGGPKGIKSAATIGSGDNTSVDENQTLDVAIVGCGIIGLMLALGLIKRGVNVKIYEQSQGEQDNGHGLAFTSSAQDCMHLLEPRILEILNKVGNGNAVNYYQYVNGYDHNRADPTDFHEELLFKIYEEGKGFRGVHRAQFLGQLLKLGPEGMVEYRKRLDTYTNRGDDQKLLLKFVDGSSAEADVLVGCDGIKSRVRQIMLGEENPASYAHFTHEVAFRGAIPIDKVIAGIGQKKALNQCLHFGPGACIVNYPIAGNTLMNVVAFVEDPSDWSTEDGKLSAPGSRTQLSERFSQWNPTIRTIINLLPEELDKWAIFDMYDHPATSYSQGRVCMAGDAAHASSPHHGAAAGIGVEDALLLSAMLEEALKLLRSKMTRGGKSKVLEEALRAFSTVRLDRSQWLVQSSREVGKVYEWRSSLVGRDAEACKKELEWRTHKVWYFDIEGMLKEGREEFERNL